MGRVLRVGLGAAVLLAALGLLAWLTGKTEIQNWGDSLVLALTDRAGTTRQLTRELAAQPTSAALEGLIERLQLNATRVDELGARWQDVDIISLLEPDPRSELEPLSQALATIRHPDYVDDLIRTRMDAAEMIGLLPTPPRTAAMLVVLKEKREPTALRRAVAEALTANPDPLVVAALDEHWYADTGRFQQQSSAPRGASREMRRARVAQLKDQDTAEADTALLAALEDADAEIRADAAWALKGRSGNRIREALIALINPEENYTVVYKALAAIDGCPNDAYLDAWLNTFNHAPKLRNLALTALTRCNDPRVVGPIVDSLDQRQTALGLEAANALTTLAAKRRDRAIEPLQRSLQNDNIGPADKAEIQRVLERLVIQQASATR